MIASIINLLQYIFLGAGFIMVLVSFHTYVRRTGDYTGLLQFWSPKLALDQREFFINRAGFGCMFIGIIMRLLYYAFYL
ncbi:hypothetical protein [Desulfurispira natronophila]|uniref:Uncharacterized protein n=1 Tax=Desulfurispira natronophila TaxID=682562 RepID=A0A7W7Y529_9BACT|nr:hypothetical protein [Desulfurispira natronophila]